MLGRRGARGWRGCAVLARASRLRGLSCREAGPPGRAGCGGLVGVCSRGGLSSVQRRRWAGAEEPWFSAAPQVPGRPADQSRGRCGRLEAGRPGGRSPPFSRSLGLGLCRQRLTAVRVLGPPSCWAFCLPPSFTSLCYFFFLPPHSRQADSAPCEIPQSRAVPAGSWRS